ncbi:MAG: hypothetical protein H0T21_09285 [Gemmatimonadaceae bacterium]|nr:hypothetical protein [Gemmatimonadaceae bacterium]
MMMKKSVSAFFLLLAGCGGGSDPAGPRIDQSDLSTMQAGEVRVLIPSDIPNGLNLPSGPAASEFVVIVGNSEPRLDRVASYQVKADVRSGASVSAAAAAAAQASVPWSALAASPLPAGEAQLRFEKRLRAYERSSLPIARAAVTGIQGLSVRKSASVNAVRALPAVGDTISVKVPSANSSNLCENFIRTRAVVRAVSRRAIIAVDTLGGAGAFSTTELTEISREFDDLTFPTDSAYFGNPTDVDRNQHVILLFTPQVNLLTPPSPREASFVAGFFFGGDFFPPTAAGCRQSNEGEIFYLLAPDPTGKFNNNVRTTASVRQGTRGTIAHEFQHMINAGNRFLNPAVSAFEATWLDEALSHFAEEVVGRAQRRFTETQTLTIQQLVPPNDVAAANDFSAFFYQNLARFRYYLVDTEAFSGLSADADTSIAARGAGWAVLRYSADTYRSADIRGFTRKLAAGPDTSVKNFVAAVGVPLDTVVANFLVTNYADHLGIANLDGKFNYRSYDMRNVMPPIEALISKAAAVYPLKVREIGAAQQTIFSRNRSGTGSYYRIAVPANAAPRNVAIVDGGGALISFPGAHVYVLRVK